MILIDDDYECLEIFPPAWNGSSLRLFPENDDGIGKTVLHGPNTYPIVLSELIGTDPDNPSFRVSGNTIRWRSMHGYMKTDGLLIRRLNYDTY